MKKLKTITALLFLIALSFTATAQFGSNTYGGQSDPSSIVGGRYANEIAAYDSTGTLSAVGTQCANCAVPNVIYRKTVTLTSTQVKNLFSVPDTILPAPGRYNSYNIISAYASLAYNSIAYAGDSVLILTVNGAIAPDFGCLDVVNASTSTTGGFNFNVGLGVQFYPSNQPLLLSTLHQNVTTGNSTLTVTVYYTKLPVPF